ncbi:hypothetical protein [Epilithonimonas sp.]|uniref:hypothetical protein n=1 Tax=Epilithonimonas sp. TaxID=2894511 RepID=UPI002898CF1B|nr:hypothetical protein [Epilithonimonas sp.]
MFSLFRKNKPFQRENFALKLSLEWGKSFGKDISERLIKKFPELNTSEIEHYKNLCKSVQNDCWNLVDYKGDSIIVDELEKRLNENVFQKYQWINKDNQRKLYSQFSYYFWKDGLLK